MTRRRAAGTSRSATRTPGRSTDALIERGVIVDFRAPDVVRIGMSPLATSFDDVDRGIGALRDLLVRG